jgi:transcriptional regulator with XRE-family HTH domain
MAENLAPTVSRLIESARLRQGLSQNALASQLGVSQQSVSRWEKGQSYPDRAIVASLADALSLDEDLLRHPKNPSRIDAGYAGQLVPSTRPLVSALPFNSLTPEQFEEFVADLLQAIYSDADVYKLGGRGDDQEGYDVIVEQPDGRKLGVQCKREQQFGAKKVEKAIAQAERSVDASIIALGRAATKAARDEIGKHQQWALWDQLDLSRKVRTLPDDAPLRIVKAYFPNYIEDFLGIPAASPWIPLTEYFQDRPQRLLNHRQTMVGREQLLKTIISWVANSNDSNVAVLFGRGGLGKSKLLYEVASHKFAEKTHFRFTVIDHVATPADFDTLPRTGKVVVVVDDEYNVQRLGSLASQLWQHRPTAKLLVTSRPDGEAVLNEQFWRLGQMPGLVTRWTLEDLSHGEACELVANLIHRSAADPWTRQLASISADCPLIAVIAAELLERGQLASSAFITDKALRAEVFRLFSESTSRGGFAADAPQRQRVLAAVAAFQPVRLSVDEFATAMTKLTAIDSWDRVNRHIHELEDAGLILRRGDSIRVVPDMLGDVILADAAYDDRANRVTSFLTMAQKAASTTPLQHLLVNASRMEWQVRQNSSSSIDMVDNLWDELVEEAFESGYDARLKLLRIASKIAYFQPRPGYDYAMAVLKAVDKDQQISSLHRQVALDEVCSVLRNVAYSISFLPRVLDVLWHLAQRDDRPINQHPEHPMRVLKSLAEIRMGKPPEYLDSVIDSVERWLTKTYKRSPLEVVEPILAVEAQEEFSSDFRVITFYSYGIAPDPVRALRQRVVSLALTVARGRDVVAAVGAVETIGRAISFPVGMFERNVQKNEKHAWAKEFIPIIHALGDLARESSLDPAVRLAIRRPVSWHLRYGLESTKSAAKSALAHMSSSEDDDIALCLHTEAMHLEMLDRRDFDSADQFMATEINRVVGDLVDNCTPSEILSRIDQRLSIERKAFGGGDNAGRFLTALFWRSPNLAKSLCVATLEGQYIELAHNAGDAIAALAQAGDSETIKLASAMLASNSSVLKQAAALGLTWNRGARALLDGEAELLIQLAQHDDESVRVTVGRAIFLLSSINRMLAFELMSKANFGGSSKIAGEALFAFSERGPLRWSDTEPELRRSVLQRLVGCRTLDDYFIIDALSELSAVDPLGVTELLLDRLDRSLKKHAFDYQALPYQWYYPLKIWQTEDYSVCLQRVREWMERAEAANLAGYLQDDGGQIFSLVAGEWTGQVLASFGDISSAPSTVSLISTARLLSHAPLKFLLSNTDFVTNLFMRAESFGRKDAEAVLRALIPLKSWSATSWLGNPLPEEAQERDLGREIASRFPVDSTAYRFFHIVADNIESDIAYRQGASGANYDDKDW